ncbi:uncharacterized protein EAF01_010676 [Botrytis porri]|uniref:uncharacterized protein n=1 Tax=Botrytis porri TaxID=87229 RepID=UPI001901F2B9|nr:uncharacterized protein EAF01_010676 [Botrytis porri]KAF7890867.1 hypothetical protein EAF01_010676 [Botrytis porri]
MDGIKPHLVLNLAASVPNPSDALKNSPLRIVPDDFMQLFAKHLTPASARSFFLTCRQIGLVIGTQYIDGLKTSKDDTLEFLNLLEHDLQDQIMDVYIHKNFGVTISNMALKNHRVFGNDAQTQRLIRLLSAPENYSHDRFSKNVTTEKRGECRLENGSLFTRKFMNYNGKCQSVGALVYIPICPHLNFEKDGFNFRATLYRAYSRAEDIWSALQLPCQEKTGTDEKNKSQDIQSGLLQCKYCLTVCKFQLKHHNRHAISHCNTALAIVVYKQFESEEDWRMHLPFYDSDDEESEPIEFSKEKISSVFEVDDTGSETRFTCWGGLT